LMARLACSKYLWLDLDADMCGYSHAIVRLCRKCATELNGFSPKSTMWLRILFEKNHFNTTSCLGLPYLLATKRVRVADL